MKTFFIDIDGTIVKHLSEKELDDLVNLPNAPVQELLPGVKDFFNSLKEDDTVIFVTARRNTHRELTERMLKAHNIKYVGLIMELSCGERYLINDSPNVFHNKAIGINVLRNHGFGDINILD
jgi:hypothetical protein